MTINDAIQGFQKDVLSLIREYELHPALASVLLQNCEHIVRDIAIQVDEEEKNRKSDKKTEDGEVSEDA